ncbi:hypothetical protein [Paraphotobacterium marinum]|nr:hypothetical protein [Paraphotobacterium marinum]
MKKKTLTQNFLSLMLLGISLNTFANHIDTESKPSNNNQIWIDNSFNIGEYTSGRKIGNYDHIFKVGFELDQDVHYFSNFYRASAHQNINAFDHPKWLDDNHQDTLDGGFTTQELYQMVILSDSDVKLKKLNLYSDTGVYDSPVKNWRGNYYRDNFKDPNDETKLQPIDHYTYNCMKIFAESDDNNKGQTILTLPVKDGSIDLSNLPYNTLTNNNQTGQKDTLHLTMIPFNSDDKCSPTASDNYDSTDVVSVFVTIKPTDYFDIEDSDPNICVIGGNRIHDHTVINGIDPDHLDQFTIKQTSSGDKVVSQKYTDNLVNNDYKINIENTHGVFSSGCEGIEIPHWEATDKGIRYVGPFTHLLENRSKHFKIRIKANTVLENFPINNGAENLEFENPSKEDLGHCKTAIEQLTDNNKTPISTLFQDNRLKDIGNFDPSPYPDNYNDLYKHVENQCFYKLDWSKINASDGRNIKGTNIDVTNAAISVDGFGVLEGNGPKGSIDSMPKQYNVYDEHEDEKYNRFYYSSGPCNFAQAVRHGDNHKSYDENKWSDEEADSWHVCETSYDVAKEAEWQVQSGTLAFASSHSPTLENPFSIDVSGITVSFGDLRKTGNVELNSINAINDISNYESSSYATASLNINQPVKLYDFKNINFTTRADGPAITADNSYAGELYIVAGDDSIKPMANNQTFENSTVLQGNSGSAIMLGQYGWNRGLNHVRVQNIIIPRIEQSEGYDVNWLDQPDNDPWDARMSVIGSRWSNYDDQFLSSYEPDKKSTDSLLKEIADKWDNYTNHYTDIVVKNVTVERLGDDNVLSKNPAYMDYEDLNHIYRFVSLVHDDTYSNTLFDGIFFKNVTSEVIPQNELRDNKIPSGLPYEIISRAHANGNATWLHIDLTGLQHKVLKDDSLTYEKVSSGYKYPFYNISDGDTFGNGKLGEKDFKDGVIVP